MSFYFVEFLINLFKFLVFCSLLIYLIMSTMLELMEWNIKTFSFVLFYFFFFGFPFVNV